jgi:type IV fimbrial biogenesis protein FimT
MKSTAAFSLIELLVTLAIVGIFLLLAISGFHTFVIKTRVTSQVNQFMSAIAYARSEAIMRGEVITLCKSVDHKTCGGQWRDGQIIINAKQQVLRVYQALPVGDQLLWFSNFKQNNFLQFSAAGFTNGQQGSFYYCPADKRYAKRIVVEQSGRVRVEDGANRCVWLNKMFI